MTTDADRTWETAAESDSACFLHMQGGAGSSQLWKAVPAARCELPCRGAAFSWRDRCGWVMRPLGLVPGRASSEMSKEEAVSGGRFGLRHTYQNSSSLSLFSSMAWGILISIVEGQSGAVGSTFKWTNQRAGGMGWKKPRWVPLEMKSACGGKIQKDARIGLLDLRWCRGPQRSRAPAKWAWPSWAAVRKEGKVAVEGRRPEEARWTKWYWRARSHTVTTWENRECFKHSRV